MSKRGSNGGGRSRSAGSTQTHRDPPPTVIRERQTIIIQEGGGRRPGLFGQMAATSAGVAVGSSVGHAVGETLTGGSRRESPQQQQQPSPGPCSNEIDQLLQCAQNNDIGLCQSYNETLKECKRRNGLK